MPPFRALFTYCRHFLRRSFHRASSSARRSMILVAFGWIGGAGRKPATRSERRRAPSGARAPSSSISGAVRTWETRPARSRIVERHVSANAATLSLDQSVATGPRGAYANAQGRGRGRRTRIWAPIAASGSPRRTAVQPFAALTLAQGESWRYEPGSAAVTNSSQRVGSSNAAGGGPLTRGAGGAAGRP